MLASRSQISAQKGRGGELQEPFKSQDTALNKPGLNWNCIQIQNALGALYEKDEKHGKRGCRLMADFCICMAPGIIQLKIVLTYTQYHILKL